MADLSALNERQQNAVVTQSKRVLVLAGAGSGKTKTLLQKIIYLIEEEGVSPSQILAITFTRNAAHEMIDRLIIAADPGSAYEEIRLDRRLSAAEKDRERFNHQKRHKWIDGLTIKTFHSFCYAVLRNHGANEFDNRFRIIGDEKRDEGDERAAYLAPETAFEVFHKLLIGLCSDTDYLLRLKRYILDYLVDKIHQTKNTPAFSSRDGRFYTTLNGTRVRSKSEQFMADWFYRHNIRFEYEPKLTVTDFSFHPDFYLPDANLYIEHVSDRSAAMRDKEEQFQKGKLLLVKTYEAMTKDTALFNQTLDRLVKNRLPGYPGNVALNFREEMSRYFEEVKDVVSQVMRITDMIKVENLNVATVAEKAASDPHERVRLFYELALPLYSGYVRYCTDKSYLDFNDLILRSIALFRHQADIAHLYRNKFRYVLVDEFQDVNNLQVELIKLLLTPETQLFCVGDDWQSIYGFRGSNVAYIIDFEKHFTPAETVKLNLNYRSTGNIVGASNEVIRNNKFRIEKEMTAARKSEHKIVVYAGSGEADNLAFCTSQIRALMNEGVTGDEILFLYRRNKMFSPYFFHFRKEGIRVQGKTIHAAKGLEARVVFIVGLTDGSGGFPDVWLEDRIFQTIKKSNHDFLIEEERRLFYVAITRAREKLFLITEKGSESGFLKEIPEIFTVKTVLPGGPVAEKAVVCENCFSQLEKADLFCRYCGHRLGSTSA